LLAKTGDGFSFQTFLRLFGEVFQKLVNTGKLGVLGQFILSGDLVSGRADFVFGMFRGIEFNR